MRFWISGFVAALVCLAWSGSSLAQVCSFGAACHSNESYSDGYCFIGPQPIDLSRSHRLAECGPGETLNRATGQCLDLACSGGHCSAAQPICPSGSAYAGGGTDRDGFYGNCDTHGDFGSIAHTVERCPAGWTLNVARGFCYGGCQAKAPPMKRLPDLVLRKLGLVQATGGPRVFTVHVGRPYLACFVVFNVGAGPAGPFRVSGGGLGVPTAPFQDHGPLAAGASRAGCLTYPTTPPVGLYHLGLTADSAHAVTEIHEDNNDGVLTVKVVP